jgi:glycerol-3-phosphate dehydrogenase
MSALSGQLAQYCLAGEVCFEKDNPSLVLCRDKNTGAELQFASRQLVLAAGAGNASLLSQLKRDRPSMQKRPVHMVMVKGKLPEIFAHCLGASANPRLTMTSTTEAGETVWYIGGQIAEAGILLNRQQQIEACKQELDTVLPWIDLRTVKWSTLMIDRAEVATPGAKRPDNSFVEADRGVITVWPTKLAFAPRAASQVLGLLQQQHIMPSANPGLVPHGWPRPELAKWPWQKTVWD